MKKGYVLLIALGLLLMATGGANTGLIILVSGVIGGVLR